MKTQKNKLRKKYKLKGGMCIFGRCDLNKTLKNRILNRRTLTNRKKYIENYINEKMKGNENRIEGFIYINQDLINNIVATRFYNKSERIKLLEKLDDRINMVTSVDDMENELGRISSYREK